MLRECVRVCCVYFGETLRHVHTFIYNAQEATHIDFSDSKHIL